MPFMNRFNLRWTWAPAFIAFYILLDWVSYVEPLFGLNITPWNPGPAFGLVCWLKYGKKTVLPWFLALVAAEYVTRGAPEKLPATLFLSACLTFGYGVIGEVLRRFFTQGEIFDNRRSLLIWLGVVVCGTLLNSLIYISLLYLIGDIPQGLWYEAYSEFAVGDVVGVVVSMPFFWLVSSKKGRSELRHLIVQRETAGYITLTLIILWLVFGVWRTSEFRHFYFLFVPLVWAASRQGVVGASIAVFFLQISFMVIVQEVFASSIPVVELQLLAAVLGTATFFMGVVVDEHRRLSEELKHSIRLASAGEMAAALAHELNQPMTALSAYAKTSARLMARGDKGELLDKAVQQMITEATRATDVVRRLRDFFRTGAITLELTSLSDLVAAAVHRIQQRAQDQQTAIDISEIPDVSFLVDPLQIEIVLHNLLSNALESVASVPEGSRHVTITATLLAGDRVCITVEDSGPGVSAALSEKLFESFSSTKPTGLGLGLAISRAIAEAHGGSLRVEPANRGIFKLVLPISEQEQDDSE